MNALTRLDRMEDFMPEFVRRFARPFALAESGPGDIRVDVIENDKDYEVRAEIPGARKEDIRVSVDGSYVSISAEVKKEKEEKSGRTIVKETYHGSVARGFSLPHEIDSKGVVAKLQDGVLKLTLPKREDAAAKSIQIQ